MFTTQAGQPITTSVLGISTTLTSVLPRLMIEFGTGQRTQLTNQGPAQYAPAAQSLYGIWDWNMSAWNTLSPSSSYASLTTAATGLASPYTATAVDLTAQTLTANPANSDVDGTNVTICWQGDPTCTTTGTLGWYANLVNNTAATTSPPAAAVYEQIIYSPVFVQGALVVNSTVPAGNIPSTCENNTDQGYTYALAVANGGVFTNSFPTFSVNGTLISDSIEAGVNMNMTGSVSVVSSGSSGSGQGNLTLIGQSTTAKPVTLPVNLPSTTQAKRLTWVERR